MPGLWSGPRIFYFLLMPPPLFFFGGGVFFFHFFIHLLFFSLIFHTLLFLRLFFKRSPPFKVRYRFRGPKGLFSSALVKGDALTDNLVSAGTGKASLVQSTDMSWLMLSSGTFWIFASARASNACLVVRSVLS